MFDERADPWRVACGTDHARYFPVVARHADICPINPLYVGARLLTYTATGSVLGLLLAGDLIGAGSHFGRRFGQQPLNFLIGWLWPVAVVSIEKPIRDSGDCAFFLVWVGFHFDLMFLRQVKQAVLSDGFLFAAA